MKDLRAKEYHRGDVFMADLGEGFGSEQGGKRPVVILQNNTGCYFSPAVTIVPFTATIKKPGLVTHYIMRRTSFLKNYSMALAEQIRTIDKHRLISYMGRIWKELQKRWRHILDSIFQIVSKHHKIRKMSRIPFPEI